MPRILSIDLKDRVPSGTAIQFLRVEMAADFVTPFALVRYAVFGQEPPNGLRLDMDKQIFLDGLPSEEKDATLGEIAPPRIVDVVRLQRTRPGQGDPISSTDESPAAEILISTGPL